MPVSKYSRYQLIFADLMQICILTSTRTEITVSFRIPLDIAQQLGFPSDSGNLLGADVS